MRQDYVSVLIKPASGLCNMRCDYCFYRDADFHARGVMTETTADGIIENVLSHARAGASFAFQGGEPTLVGLPFFEHFVEQVNARNRNGIPVTYAIQTNGLAIDEAWARFFADNHFLVGLSMDGPAELHDGHRRSVDGSGTFESVSRAAKFLREAGADFNILCVVTADLSRKGKKVYEWFRAQHFGFLQFILCLEPEEGVRHGKAPTPDRYAAFLIDVFNAWYEDWRKGVYCSVRYFDNLVQMLLGGPAELCSLRGECTNQLVAESDGECYPCDFYVEERYRLGNLASDPLDALWQSDGAKRFLTDGIRSDRTCVNCEYRRFCGGGCRRERFGSGRTAYCEAYQKFFKICLPRLALVAEDLRKGYRPAAPDNK